MTVNKVGYDKGYVKSRRESSREFKRENKKESIKGFREEDLNDLIQERVNPTTYPFKTKKYLSSMLIACLLNSSLLYPAYGMTDEDWKQRNWSALFIKTHSNVSLGSQILTRLDERPLVRASRVSQGWRSLVHKTQDERYEKRSQGKEPLFKAILESVGAEADEVTRAWHTLSLLMESSDFQGQASILVKQKLMKMKPRLLQPEALILRDEVDDFLECKTPHKNHPALSSLVQVIKDLEELEQAPQFKQLKSENLKVFIALKALYEQYLKNLLDPEVKKVPLLQPKVILSGEGLMGAGSYEIQSYRISQERALSLLSKDRYGLFLKHNVLGSHAVKKQGEVHFKGNTTNTGLPVGRESAAYWFAQVLFGESLTPSALLTLNEVEIKTTREQTQARCDYAVAQATGKTSSEFFKDFPQHQEAFTERTPHHVLQASLSVVGMSLEDFMKGAETGKYSYKDLDLNSFSELIFMSLLTNPSDGTPGNFMVRTNQGKPYPIVGIDNDMAFGPSIVLIGRGNPSLEVKNVLYCLPLMDEPLALEIRDKILSASPKLFLLRWLERLKIQQHLYDKLKETHYPWNNKNVPFLEGYSLRLMGEAPTGDSLSSIKQGEVALFCKNDKLYCKMLNKNPIEIIRSEERNDGGFNSKRFDRIITILKTNSSFKKLSEEDTENLISFKLLKDYTDCANNIYIMGLHLPVCLPSGLLTTLLEDFTKLQEKIKSRSAITHTQLFSFFQPLVHRFYTALQDKYPTPLAAYHVIHNSVHENINLEDILEPHQEEILVSGQTLSQALQKITQQEQTQPPPLTIDQSTQEIWKNLDLNAQSRIAPFLELATTTFLPCFQDKGTFHSSWFQQNLLFRALKERASYHAIDFLLNSLKLDVSVRDSHTHQNVLHCALTNKNPLKILKLLVGSLEPQEQYTLLNALDHEGLSPLDQAMEQNEREAFCHLRELGAISCSPTIALNFYKRTVKSNPTLHQAFQKLMDLNGAVEWAITLEELLPQIVSKKDYLGNIIISSTYGERQLPKDIKDQIFDQKGEFKRVPTQGNHPVAYAKKEGPLKTHGFYFKAYPALPGLEEAAGSFTRYLLGYGAPYTDLVKIGGAPCLISQEIPGETLQKVLETKPHLLNDLDDEDISGLMIAAMLINPEDGKPDNYILTPHPIKQNKYRLVGIDNDQAFVPAIVKETPDKAMFTGKVLPIAQVKTILYCLDQMKNPIDPKLRAKIINLHPDRFLENWLRALKRINNQHCGLFTGSEQIQAFEKHKCFIGVPFQQGAIRHIYEKFVHLRDLLTDNHTLTHIELLNKLEPRLAKRYQAALNKNLSVKERFGQVDRPFYEVKTDIRKGESHTTVTQSGDILQSMGIPLQEKIFDSIRLGKEKGPLQALEELERIKREKNAETLKSLSLRVGDINLLKTLKLEESRVLFLKELEKQKKILTPQEQIAILDYLTLQKGIRELPLPNFSVLDDTLFQKIPFEHFKKVDLRKCSKISYVSLVPLSQKALALEELNLSYNPQLKEIGDIGTFTDAPLFFKELRFLNLENCTSLSKLLIQAPKLHYLNIENCALLNDQMLDGVIEHSPHLQKLVFEGCPLVAEKELREKYPNFPASYLKNVNKKDPIYKILESKGPELKFGEKEIDTSPQGLMAFGKALKINVQLFNLITLELNGNNIGKTGAKALASSNLTGLTSLNLGYHNNIEDEGARALANGNLIGLTSLELENNYIGATGAKALSTSNFKGLEWLNLGLNKVGDEGARALANGNLIGLTSLNLWGNKIENEGAKALANGNLLALTSLHLNINNIGDEGTKSLANGNLTGLTSLDLWGNNIAATGTKALGLGNFTSLTVLNLGKNNLGEGGAKALASSNLSGLTKLDLGANEIGEEGARALANSNITRLTELNLHGNSFGDEGAMALGLGNLTNLTKLNLSKNKIGETGTKALANGNLSGLTSLYLRYNKIGNEGARALANGNLTGLRVLDLSHNKTGDEGAKAIANGNLTDLRRLNLWSNNIGYETQKVLKEKFGNVSF